MRRLKRLFKPVRWHNLRTKNPISRIFGLDRGTPVDRYYIEAFLRKNSDLIKGRVLEIGSAEYTRKFGSHVDKSEVLHFTEGNSEATLTGDLSKRETLPENFADCFICTQTFNFIYDYKKAVENTHFLLNRNGVALVTLAGVCQISRYDMERWGDFWRFTTASASRAFSDVFGESNIAVNSYGNVLSTISLLHGIAAEELTPGELDYMDPDYQTVITVIAKKC